MVPTDFTFVAASLKRNGKIIWKHLNVLSIFTGASFNPRVLFRSAHGLMSTVDLFLLFPSRSTQRLRLWSQQFPTSLASTSWNTTLARSPISLCNGCRFFLHGVVSCLPHFKQGNADLERRVSGLHTTAPSCLISGQPCWEVLRPSCNSRNTFLIFLPWDFSITMKCHPDHVGISELPYPAQGPSWGTVYLVPERVPAVLSLRCPPGHPFINSPLLGRPAFPVWRPPSLISTSVPLRIISHTPAVSPAWGSALRGTQMKTPTMMGNPAEK